MYSYFKVEATLDDNGNIDATSLKVTSLSEKSSEKDTATKAASGWTITAYLNALDLKGIEPAGE